MNCQRKITISVFIIALFFYSFITQRVAYGATSTDIDAKIKISVCGNSIAEGGEDCDTTDLKGATCQQMGYTGGTLSCHISCSYDTSSCYMYSPTPSPTQNAQTSPTSTTNEAVAPTIQAESKQEILPTTNEVLTQSQPAPKNFFQLNPQASLPIGLHYFDRKNTGKILLSDLSTVVTLWVDDWMVALKNDSPQNSDKDRTCDINRDNTCDLKDFSILMSYIEK